MKSLKSYLIPVTASLGLLAVSLPAFATDPTTMDTNAATTFSGNITTAVSTVLAATFVAVVGIAGTILAVLLAWKYIKKFLGMRKS